jgi:predicted O-linked N-acetylglucosamine transferase (SPINDLY family)
MTYLGYPDTTGLSTMDYRITDRWADPIGCTESLHTEALLHLPDGFLCYQAPADAPPVAALPAEGAGLVTFGFLNDLPKVNSGVIEVWAAVLRAIPRSRLLVKAAGLAEKAGQHRLEVAFRRRGISAERLVLLGRSPTLRAHLEQYAKIDVALDTFPYNATTTTCDALWMGVPVISLAGRSHVARVGTSILSRAGLSDLVAESAEEYVRLAVQLANNLDRLRALRGGLRGQLKASVVMDAQRIVRALESAYVHAWRRRCLSPAGV